MSEGTPVAVGEEVGVVRRVPRSAGRFSGRVVTPQTEDQLVSRAILGGRTGKKPTISRNHIVAGDLPDWEPLPPGELTVRRTGNS